jgi:hypothetical protein
MPPGPRACRVLPVQVVARGSADLGVGHPRPRPRSKEASRHTMWRADQLTRIGGPAARGSGEERWPVLAASRPRRHRVGGRHAQVVPQEGGGDVGWCDNGRRGIRNRQRSQRRQCTVVPGVCRRSMLAVVLMTGMFTVMVMVMMGLLRLQRSRQGHPVHGAHLGDRHSAHVCRAGGKHGHRCLEDQRTDGSPQGESR